MQLRNPATWHVLDAMRAERSVAQPAQPPQAQRRVPRLIRRSFDGAKVDRLTSSFSADHVSLNQTLEHSLRILRGRSRNLYKNNDYVKKFFRMVMNHVVGPNGFTLSVPCQRPDGSIDEFDKAVVEKAFKKWAKRGTCDVTGRLSFVQLQRLAVLLVARDGECLIRRVRDSSMNAFGYALQVLDPVLLDESYRADFPDGRRIRMGVETNEWGKPIAYHLLQDVESPFGGRRVRVPASEIWHLFIQEEPNQVRGVPWIHSAMLRLNDLGKYEEAAVIAARVGASNMGFFIPPKDDVTSGTGQLADEVTRGQQADGLDQVELVRDATPGAFDELPPGYDFKHFDPDYPHANFGAFVKAMLRGVASGIGADYNTLANDLEGVNYSSIRTGKLETQDEWMCLQGQFVEWFLDPLSPEWLSHAFLAGQLGSLPVSKFDKYDCFSWQGRRWPWVDPEKDMKAKVIELENDLTSPSQVMRELGRDPETVWREIEKDRLRIAKLPKRPNAAPAQPAGASVSKPAKDDQGNDDEDA
jgi:lambda family phage portal protein